MNVRRGCSSKGGMCSSSASTVTREMDETAENIEAQLVGLMSHCGTQSRLMSLPSQSRTTVPVFVQSIFQEDMQGDMLRALLLATNQHHSCRTIQE